MILGVGTDLCDIRRLERILKRFAGRFTERVYAQSERKTAEARTRPANAYAQRYAAKEACAKALGTGFSGGVFWRDLVVENLPSGQPVMRLGGGAAKRLDALTPVGMEARVDLSLSDEYPLAQAVVIISAAPIA